MLASCFRHEYVFTRLEDGKVWREWSRELLNTRRLLGVRGVLAWCNSSIYTIAPVPRMTYTMGPFLPLVRLVLHSALHCYSLAA